MANEGVLTERTKFAQPHESVTAWERRVKEQGRRLEYSANCEDQLLRDKFISGINNKRLLSKLLDKGHRDKATKEITSFKTMLQIAKNFEQCEKAKAVMQQASNQDTIGHRLHLQHTTRKSCPLIDSSWEET